MSTHIWAHIYEYSYMGSYTCFTSTCLQVCPSCSTVMVRWFQRQTSSKIYESSLALTLNTHAYHISHTRTHPNHTDTFGDIVLTSAAVCTTWQSRCTTTRSMPQWCGHLSELGVPKQRQRNNPVSTDCCPSRKRTRNSTGWLPSAYGTLRMDQTYLGGVLQLSLTCIQSCPFTRRCTCRIQLRLKLGLGFRVSFFFVNCFNVTHIWVLSGMLTLVTHTLGTGVGVCLWGKANHGEKPSHERQQLPDGRLVAAPQAGTSFHESVDAH